MKINIILEKVPIDSFEYETINIILEEDEISWNKISNDLWNIQPVRSSGFIFGSILDYGYGGSD